MKYIRVTLGITLERYSRRCGNWFSEYS